MNKYLHLALSQSNQKQFFQSILIKELLLHIYDVMQPVGRGRNSLLDKYTHLLLLNRGMRLNETQITDPQPMKSIHCPHTFSFTTRFLRERLSFLLCELSDSAAYWNKHIWPLYILYATCTGRVNADPWWVSLSKCCGTDKHMHRWKDRHQTDALYLSLWVAAITNNMY